MERGWWVGSGVGAGAVRPCGIPSLGVGSGEGGGRGGGGAEVWLRVSCCCRKEGVTMLGLGWGAAAGGWEKVT